MPGKISAHGPGLHSFHFGLLWSIVACYSGSLALQDGLSVDGYVGYDTGHLESQQPIIWGNFVSRMGYFGAQ